ncbi:MAG: tetratricopeptide repeat protein [bacterium]
MSLDQSKIFLYHSLGSAYLEKGMFKEAIQAFKDALRVSPDEPNSYYNLGVAYWKGGRIKEAISAYRKVLKLSPNYPGVAESLRILEGKY